MLAENNLLDCSNLVNYSCETRSFGENLVNEVLQGQTCIFIDTKEICVPTVNRMFNTSAARQVYGYSEIDFSEGGEFNRHESNCSYFDISKNMNLLRVENEVASVALRNLVTKCSEAQQVGK